MQGMCKITAIPASIIADGTGRWPEYSPENRETLFFNDDATTSVVNDPLPKERELIEKILHYYVAL